MENAIVKDEQATLLVQVKPNSSQNKIIHFKDDVLHLRIAAPPVKGKANQELIKFLSNTLGVSKHNLSIEKGITAKRKLIVINGLTQNQIMVQLEKWGTRAETI